MNKIMEKEGFDYRFNPETCQLCRGNCCCGESGRIWVTEKDIAEISKLLKINSIDFLAKYTIRINNRLSLKEQNTKRGFACTFFRDQKGCSIYSVRPKQCSDYPFWDIFKTEREIILRECPGIIDNSV